MKTSHYFIALSAALLFAFCKTTKQPAAAPVATPPPVATASATDSTSPAAIQKRIIEKRWPGTAEEDVKEGQVIYTTKCIKCHKAYRIEEFGEKKWLHEIDDMSPKAKLTPEEKMKLTKYVLSYRETKAVLQGKN